MRKPYVITSLNEMPGKDRWIRTLQCALGNSVQPVIIMWQPHFEVPPDFLVHKLDSPYPGHLEKLMPLLDMDLDRDRWFIFTDGADVLFQAPLPDVGGTGYRVLLANEGLRHADSDFWRPHLDIPLYAGLASTPVYNVGSWAAIGHEFLNFVRFLSAMRRLCQERGWPIVDVHEQLIYNTWVQAQVAKCGELENLFCTLYANYTGPLFNGQGSARLQGGRFVNRRHQPYAIVHGNGSTKGLLDRLVPPTGDEDLTRLRWGLRTGE